MKFQKKNVVEAKSIFIVCSSEILFGHFDSKELAEECLKEVLEYISENKKKEEYFYIRQEQIFYQSCFEHSGKLPKEFQELYDSCPEAYEEISKRIDERYFELWSEQFGKVSDEEFEKMYEKIYAHEHFSEYDVPEIQEIKVYSRS